MRDILKNPAYGNCLVLAPDGQPLCRASRKRSKWYLERKLAQVVRDEEILVIKLLFEPANRRSCDDEFIIAEKENKCVCCGETTNLTKHHVVPHEFKRYFPDDLKNHSSHDILVLCFHCHSKYEILALELRRKLSHQCEIPVAGLLSDNIHLISKAKGAAKALYGHFDLIPEHRRNFLLQKLQSYYNKDEITREDIFEATKLKPKKICITPFGKVVAEKLNPNDLIMMWRKHFIETMKPQYLPQYWDINYRYK